MAEIVCVCLDMESERKRDNVGPDDAARYAQWWNSLTPEEMLWAEYE